MRAGAPTEVLSGSCSWTPTVSAWLGGTWLGDVPILSGHVVASVSQAVPERVTLTVPRFDGRDWRPRTATDPLARYGQELQVSITVGSAVTGLTWESRVGRFLITDWDDDDEGRIRVVAEGRLRRVLDDKLTTPTSPASGGTLKSEARRLLPAGMSAAFDTALVDRVCPASMSWPEDRLAALQEIADAWPAILRTDEWGQVRFKAPLPLIPAPVLTLTDGERGTLVASPRSDTRKGAFNRVVARSSAADMQDVQAVADQVTGPMATSGDYGVVTSIMSSPLLATAGECAAAAAAKQADAVRPTQVLPLTLAPDPRIDLDDPLAVTRDGEIPRWGYVTAYDLPLTVDDGPMRVDVSVA